MTATFNDTDTFAKKWYNSFLRKLQMDITQGFHCSSRGNKSEVCLIKSAAEYLRYAFLSQICVTNCLICCKCQNSEHKYALLEKVWFGANIKTKNSNICYKLPALVLKYGSPKSFPEPLGHPHQKTKFSCKIL